MASDSVNSLLFRNSNMWHFVVCWRQYDTHSIWDTEMRLCG